MTRWPCMFRSKFIRDDINPRLAKQFSKVPWAAFQRNWRSEHCSQLDPYGLGQCPYRREDCGLAYYQTAQKALTESTTSPVGLFRILARKYGAVRADNKPLMRDTRTDGQRPSKPRVVEEDLEEGQVLRRGRMESVASLLRKPDGGSLLAHPGREEGEAGPER